MKPEHSKLPRISWQSIAEYLLEQFNLERGLGYTIKQMLLRPKKAVQEYLFEDRHRMVKPLGFMLLVVAIAAFMSSFLLDFESTIAEMVSRDAGLKKLPEEIQKLLIRFFELSQQYFNLFLMANIPTITLSTFLIFKEKGLNFPEHLVINVYIFSIQTLLIMPFIPFLLDSPLLGFIILVINLGYFYYALTKIFELQWGEGVLKTVLVYFLGQAFQSVLIGLILGSIALVRILF